MREPNSQTDKRNLERDFLAIELVSRKEKIYIVKPLFAQHSRGGNWREVVQTNVRFGAATISLRNGGREIGANFRCLGWGSFYGGGMKLHSWNVNGIRAAQKKGFEDYVVAHQPDLLLLQETKAQPDQVEFTSALDDWKVFWNSAERKGYSGVGILSREEPLNVSEGIGMTEHDSEGRVLTLEFPDFYLVSVYTPNAQNELRRLDYRQQWDRDFLKYIGKLEEEKPVIFGGDLNVAHTEIDLARPKANRMNAGFTDEERAGFDNIVKAGFIDSFRSFHPEEPDHYSWWSFRGGARARNVGWRLDYFCVSPQLRDWMQSAKIHADVMGSDHCPVELILG